MQKGYYKKKGGASKWKRTLIFFLITLSTQIQAQSNFIVIDEIEISGNKKTKDFIILREIEVREGDTVSVSEIEGLILKSEENLFRTRLFFEVGINWKTRTERGESMEVLAVEVKEAWYIYPVFIFELADRNFNVWWNEMNAKLDRINYGLRLDHLNLTGRNDKLKLKAQAGYEQKWELSYRLPNVNQNKTWGVTANVLFAQRKEIGYIARNNILRFASHEDPIYRRFRLTHSWIYRPKYQQQHEIKAEYYQNWIDLDFVSQYNENFLRDGRSRLKWVVLEYRWTHDNTNHFNYPTSGWQAEMLVRKEGLGIFDQVNILNITTGMARYIPFGSEDNFSLGIAGKVRKFFTVGNPGYYHNTALGYGSNQLRGYEFYVIDGQDYGFVKTHLNYRFLSWGREFGKWMFIPQFRKFNLQAFVSASLDVGYVSSAYFNESNDYNNTLLVGGGPSLHILLYNYFLFRLEYSYNRADENGLFLHFKASF